MKTLADLIKEATKPLPTPMAPEMGPAKPPPISPKAITKNVNAKQPKLNIAPQAAVPAVGPNSMKRAQVPMPAGPPIPNRPVLSEGVEVPWQAGSFEGLARGLTGDADYSAYHPLLAAWRGSGG
jgi:hypothetical protein